MHKIIITGGNGFIGKELLKIINKKNILFTFLILILKKTR